jgi:hypothetical protein
MASMVAVRYVALAALVFWLGGQTTEAASEMLRRPDLVGYVCGGAIVIALLVMKFVGPPPRSFRLRLAIVLVMLGVTAYAARGIRGRAASSPATAVNIALGAVLLVWYARE